MDKSDTYSIASQVETSSTFEPASSKTAVLFFLTLMNVNWIRAGARIITLFVAVLLVVGAVVSYLLAKNTAS